MTNDSKPVRYVPVTPGGTLCTWLASGSEDQAWANLMEDAAHMPYRTKQAFMERGYRVEPFQSDEDDL